MLYFRSSPKLHDATLYVAGLRINHIETDVQIVDVVEYVYEGLIGRGDALFGFDQYESRRRCSPLPVRIV